MRTIKSIVAVGALMLLFCSAASAVVLLDVTSSLTASDATQLGRLFRANTTLSDWSAAKPFPGISGSSTSYHYRTYTIPAFMIGPSRYIQISVDDASITNFVSAYTNAFLPNSVAANRGLDTNYLGDVSGSGQAFGGMRFFQVVVPAGDDLVLHVSEITTGGGFTHPFRILAEGFTDTLYSDPPLPDILSIHSVNNTDLFFTAANGLSNRNYRVLMSTNVAQSFLAWTPIWTNLATANGTFTFTVPNTVVQTNKSRFYILQLQ